MTFQLPSELESRLQAVVLSGRFASLDDAMAEAARLLLRELEQSKPPANSNDPPPDPILGLMRDDTELMDEIVEEAYRHRQEDRWREIDL